MGLNRQLDFCRHFWRKMAKIGGFQILSVNVSWAYLVLLLKVGANGGWQSCGLPPLLAVNGSWAKVILALNGTKWHLSKRVFEYSDS